MNDSLFDLETVKQDSPRLAAIKAADIQTHHAPHMSESWLAIPMNLAREVLDEYDLTRIEKTSIPDMMAGYCRLLDDAGIVFQGPTQKDVEDDALAWLTVYELNK
jgi:hypothetical protein